MDFPQFRDIHYLIPQVLDLRSIDTTKSDYHQIEDSDKWEIYVKYRKIVSQFLIDQTRSEIPPDPRGSSINFVLWSKSQDNYVRLAKYLLSFLRENL